MTKVDELLARSSPEAESRATDAGQLDQPYIGDKRLSKAYEAKTVRRGWVIIGTTALLIVLALWLAQQPLLDLLSFFRDQEAVSVYIKGLGIRGAVLVALLQLSQVIVAIIPGHALCVGCGYAYGFPVGFVFNLLMTVGASQVAFTLARWAGRPLVNRLAPAESVDRWNAVAERHGFFFFLTCFLLPVFATDVMNFVAGLSSISGKKFLVASFLGRIPGMLLLTLVGSHGVEIASFEISPMVWVVIAVASLGLFIVWRHLFSARWGLAAG